jgi:hypothetical protein
MEACMTMWVVFDERFDPELHSVWGPFASRADAMEWIDTRPDIEHYLIERVIRPDVAAASIHAGE